jgi:hypothetical protein
MKFIDKYKEEHQGGIIGDITCIKCPSDFGYEPDRNCTCGPDDEACHRCWNKEMPEPKLEPANANDFPGFEINDVVQLRSGRLCIVLPNNKSKDNKSICYTNKKPSTEDIIGSGITCLTHCIDYIGYICERNCLNDVVKLWRATPENALSLIGYFFNKKEIPDHIKPIWVEPTVPTAKKMTLKEIEKELGYSIEIIS